MNANLQALINYLNSSDAEKLAELQDGGYMETIEGEEIADFDDTIDYWMGEQATVLPAWTHIDYVRTEGSAMLVHVTSAEKAATILANGFKGIEEMSKVATSTAHRDSAYSSNGFCFAYTASDIASGKAKEIGFFGDVAVVFTADAIRVKSSFDGDEQMIFVARDARDMQVMSVADAYNYCESIN